jgi:NADP-reducing hydrogenase subunit HndB
MEEKKKLRSQDLATIREGRGRAKVTVHTGACGIAADARDIMDALLDEMKEKGVRDVVVTTSGRAGLCNQEPVATVELKDPPSVKSFDLAPEKTRKILVKPVLGGPPATEYALAAGSETLY